MIVVTVTIALPQRNATFSNKIAANLLEVSRYFFHSSYGLERQLIWRLLYILNFQLICTRNPKHNPPIRHESQRCDVYDGIGFDLGVQIFISVAKVLGGITAVEFRPLPGTQVENRRYSELPHLCEKQGALFRSVLSKYYLDWKLDGYAELSSCHSVLDAVRRHLLGIGRIRERRINIFIAILLPLDFHF